MTSNIFKYSLVNLTKLYVLVITMFFLTFQVNNSFAGKKKIVLAADYSCPYNCYPTDVDQGFLVEIAKKVFAIYDIEVEYKLLSWSDALNRAEKGDIEGVIGLIEGDDRDFAITPNAQVKSYISVFTNPNTEWLYDGINSLKGKRIAIIQDHDLNDAINQYIAVNYPRDPDMFLLEDGNTAVINSINHLINGSVNLLFEDEIVVNHYLAKHKLNHAVKNAGRIDSTPLPKYIAFSRKSNNSQEYVKMLEEGMASIKATGDLEDLKRKYGILY